MLEGSHNSAWAHTKTNRVSQAASTALCARNKGSSRSSRSCFSRANLLNFCMILWAASVQRPYTRKPVYRVKAQNLEPVNFEQVTGRTAAPVSPCNRMFSSPGVKGFRNSSSLDSGAKGRATAIVWKNAGVKVTVLTKTLNCAQRYQNRNLSEAVSFIMSCIRRHRPGSRVPA